MRLRTSVLCTTVAIGLLAGCTGNMSAPTGSMPSVGAQSRTVLSVYGDAAPPMAVSVLHSLVLPIGKPAGKKKPTTGTYVTQFDASTLYGYPAVNKTNKKPTCTITGIADVNDVAMDSKGNMIDPDGGSSTIFIFKGPGMCGKVVGSISDTYGQPADASSPTDALTGKIAVSDLADGTSTGNILVCTVKAGCSTELTNGNIYHAGGIAMAPNGDCWDDAKTSSTGGAALIYFKGCAGGGKVATGFKSTYYGGIDLDNSGHLVIIDDMAENVYIYSGCNPACKVVGGPFALKGESFFGKLNQANTDYIAVDRTDAVVDVYSYSTKALKFEYSYNADLEASMVPDGIAQNPRSKE